MACDPIHIDLEVDPDANSKITLTLDKTCDENDQATWKLSFQLQQGDPLAIVALLYVELDTEYYDKAQATADYGLEEVQQAQAQVAAAIATDVDATDDDKLAAIQQIIAVRETSGTGPR